MVQLVGFFTEFSGVDCSLLDPARDKESVEKEASLGRPKVRSSAIKMYHRRGGSPGGGEEGNLESCLYTEFLMQNPFGGL